MSLTPEQNHNSDDFISAEDVASPSDVSSTLLTALLNEHYNKNNNAAHNIEVSSFQWRPLGRGVLSNVQLLDAQYKKSDNNNNNDNDAITPYRGMMTMPTRFLAKFRKEEIPLEELFPVEGQFYRLIKEFPPDGNNNNNDNDFPFHLVDMIAAGPSWILLEYIPLDDNNNIDIIDVHEGCPSDRFDDLLIRLARMHAACWISEPSSSTTTQPNSIPGILKINAHKLSSTPGAGHTLPPSIRQTQFAAAWPAVRERLIPYFQSNEGAGSLKLLNEMVSWTAQSHRIEGIAQSVAEKRYTLVHGDFHIGNMLLPQTSPETNNQDNGGDMMEESLMPWLVDWSMAGIGNPCIDLVFFLVVGADAIPTKELEPSSSGDGTSSSQSTTTETTTECLELILRKYYQSLISERVDPSSKATKSPLPLPCEALFLKMFRQCLLNQFIILVCYDDLCRSMADASSSSEIYHDHFDRVNARCARMLLSEYGFSPND